MISSWINTDAPCRKCSWCKTILFPPLIFFWNTIIEKSNNHRMMVVIEPGENPTRTLTWKSLVFLSHIKRRTNDDRFPLPLWETWFCSSLGVLIPVLIGPAQHAKFFNMIHMTTIWRHGKLNHRFYRLTTGLFVGWVCYLVLWVTRLRSTRQLLQRVKNGVILT
jgi:hypothetical protein